MDGGYTSDFFCGLVVDRKVVKPHTTPNLPFEIQTQIPVYWIKEDCVIIRVGKATVVTEGNTLALHTSHIMKLLQQFPLQTTPPNLFPHAPPPPKYFLLFI